MNYFKKFSRFLFIISCFNLLLWLFVKDQIFVRAEEPAAANATPPITTTPSNTGASASPGNPAATSAAPQNLTIEAALDKAQITVRDIVTYTITTRYPNGYKIVVWPQLANKINDLRIVDLGSEEATQVGDRWQAKKWFKLRADLSGSYVLPPVEVVYESPDGTRATEKTGEVFLEVLAQSPMTGAAPKTDETSQQDLEELMDIAEPQSLGVHPYWYYFGSALGACLLLATLGFVWHKRRKRPPELPPRPPHEIALESLSQMKVSAGASEEEIKKFHFALSHILRQYVEQRYQLPATDRTTEEIADLVGPISELNQESRDLLLDILKKTDRVKFTDFNPEEQWSMETLSKVATFITGTRVDLKSVAGTQDSDNEFI